MDKKREVLLKIKNIRGLTHTTTNTHYFCAVDVCQMIGGTSYQTAKSYWKNIKRRAAYFSFESGYRAMQLSLPAGDGKFYLTDVITLADMIYLLKISKHKGKKRVNLFVKLRGMFALIELLKQQVQRYTNVVLDIMEKMGKQMVMSVVVNRREFVLSNRRKVDCEKVA